MRGRRMPERERAGPARRKASRHEDRKGNPPESQPGTRRRHLLNAMPQVPSTEVMQERPFEGPEDCGPAPFEQRARSFGSIAEQYARFRPSPPAEAVDWVLGRPRHSVLDLAAGTGALTAMLVRRTPRVVAAEPDAEMRAVLHKSLPGVPLVAATAEALPFVPACFDAVVVSSAWHWMDAEIASIEVSRVLEPDGVLGLLWNGADRSQDWVEALVGPGLPPALQVSRRSAHRHVLELPNAAPFHDLENRTVRWSMRFTVEELVGLMGTYSRVFTLPEESRDRMLANRG